jgi:hypothetical protein
MSYLSQHDLWIPEGELQGKQEFTLIGGALDDADIRVTRTTGSTTKGSELNAC